MVFIASSRLTRVAVELRTRTSTPDVRNPEVSTTIVSWWVNLGQVFPIKDDPVIHLLTRMVLTCPFMINL